MKVFYGGKFIEKSKLEEVGIFYPIKLEYYKSIDSEISKNGSYFGISIVKTEYKKDNVIVETKDFLSSFCKKNDSEVINKSDCFDFTSKKIITKCDIIDIVNNYSSIKVNRNVIITPLVMDYIKDNKINILYE